MHIRQPQKIPQSRHHLPKLCFYGPVSSFATCPLLPFRCPSIQSQGGMDMHLYLPRTLPVAKYWEFLGGGFVRTLPETHTSWNGTLCPPHPVVLLAVPLPPVWVCPCLDGDSLSVLRNLYSLVCWTGLASR